MERLLYAIEDTLFITGFSVLFWFGFAAWFPDLFNMSVLDYAKYQLPCTGVIFVLKLLTYRP